MGIPRPKDLSDLRKLDADLKVTCRRCGRSAVFPLLPLLNHFRQRGWNTAWHSLSHRFACRGVVGRPGCGAKEIALGLEPRDNPEPPKPRLTAREIKELVRRSRG
ncbi:MAG TPA: hypothetical protein VF582_09310 [Allosphingosinicella sp.]|jgi:hypothetical protein